MAIVKSFTKKDLELAKSYFAMRGTKSACEEETKISRQTITRVIGNGTGEERVIDTLTEYVRSK